MCIVAGFSDGGRCVGVSGRTGPVLTRARALLGYTLSVANEEIGQLKEFYFDDRHRVVRYLVADTGDWLADRQVLFSPYARDSVSRELRRILLRVTKRQLEESPRLGGDEPVSEQFEDAYSRFHGWPKYWCGPYVWGHSAHINRDRRRWQESAEDGWARQVRSTDGVIGNYVQTTDGEIGQVEDFIIDDDVWAIRYLIISTRNWWPGKRVLVAPQWIQRVNWGKGKMFVDLSGEVIRRSPEFTERQLVTREYEGRVHRHYDRRGYWMDDPESICQ